MRLLPVTPPQGRVLQEHELAAHLRLVGLSIEDLFTLWVYEDAALGAIDGPDGWLGRALLTQTWDLRLDRFPAEIELPLPPLQSVQGVAYIDPAGAAQTLAPAAYRVLGAGGSAPARIVPAHGTTWPTTRAEPEAVTVEFVAGYGTAADVPAPIKAALLLRIADSYENREATTPERLVPTGAAEALLRPYRVWAP